MACTLLKTVATLCGLYYVKVANETARPILSPTSVVGVMYPNQVTLVNDPHFLSCIAPNRDPVFTRSSYGLSLKEDHPIVFNKDMILYTPAVKNAVKNDVKNKTKSVKPILSKKKHTIAFKKAHAYHSIVPVKTVEEKKKVATVAVRKGLIHKVTPKVTPKATPKAPSKTESKASPKASPKATPKATPKASPKATPKATPKAPSKTPSKTAPKTAPKDVRKETQKEAPSKAPKEVEREVRKEVRPIATEKPTTAVPTTATAVKEHEEHEENEEEEHPSKKMQWWKKHVHHSLHNDVEHYLKNDKHHSHQHPTFHFLKKKIKEWWNDEEEDDEHDLKKMKHIFSTVRKGKTIDAVIKKHEEESE